MDVKRITRRSLLSTAIVGAAYGLYRYAANENWIIATLGARPFDEGTRPISRNPDSDISLLVVGDTGLSSPERSAVVNMMSELASIGSPDGVVMLGDNFYEKGVESVSDPRFQSDFEQLFDSHIFDCPFHVALGNHDYMGNPLAQVEYTDHSDRWHMPQTYYKVRYTTDDASLDLFVIDTNPIHDGEPGIETQVEWLGTELGRSDADWKIVAGHHPCLSGGEHGGSPEVQRLIAPLLSQHGVAVYLAGHDHDLQLLDSGLGWYQLVSGSGSKLRTTSWIEETVFASASSGFSWLLIQNGQLFVSIFDDKARLLTKVIPKPARWASRPAPPASARPVIAL